jgi:hypothetical protein
MEFTIEGIIDHMKRPDSLTPANVVHYYSFLTSIFAQYSVELCDALADTAKMECELLKDETVTSAKAKQLVRGSDEGKRVIKLTGRIKAIEELIRSLKAAQKYFLEEAKNTV